MSFKEKNNHSKKGFGRVVNNPENMDFQYRGPRDAGDYGRKTDTIEGDFQKKAFRDMAFGTVLVKVDPNSEASRMSDPYAILNAQNSVIDAKYAGQDNISGKIIMQLPTSSLSSLWAIPDVLETKVGLNYNYCKMTDSDNADPKVNGKMAVAWREILQSTAASAYYDLPFFSWTVEAIDDNRGAIYSGDGLLELALAYQVPLQAAYALLLRYRQTRSLEQHLKDMCYQNGAQVLSTLYAKLNKSATVNAFTSISNIILGHYLDTKWLSQIGMILSIPSRKRNDMVDPLMIVTPRFNVNSNLSVKVSGTSPDEIFNTSYLDDYMEKVNSVMDTLSPTNLLKLARQDPSRVWSASDLNQFEKSFVDPLIDIVGYLNKFTADFADLLVAFKRMSQVGLTDWKVGQYIAMDRFEQNYQPKFNKLVFDITRSCLTGSTQIQYNPNNNQWETLSLWDVYTGLNTYDRTSGGSVLTFSTKQVTTTDGADIPGSVTYPAMFKWLSTDALTRRGIVYPITKTSTVLTDAQKRILGKLIPLTSIKNTTLNIPTVDLTSLVDSPTDQSWIINMMIHVYGYANAKVTNNTFNVNIDPDILTQTDVIIDDLTNAVETFTRQRAPFKVLVTTNETVLGFVTGKTRA